MAAALPYAIGVQVAYPNRQVVAFTGDGSLTMQMGDLATLIQEELPVKVIVFKNNSLGLIKWEQMVFIGNPEYGVDFAPVDFVKIAEGFGARAFHIEDPSQCGETLREALAHRGPAVVEAVVEAVVDPNEPPMPAKITSDQAKALGEALARGEEQRKPDRPDHRPRADRRADLRRQPLRRRRTGQGEDRGDAALRQRRQELRLVAR